MGNEKQKTYDNYRNIFQVRIDGFERVVLDIPELEHAGLNDTPKTWWVLMQSKYPITRDILEPYSAGLNRIPWSIRIFQENTSKQKFGSIQFSSHTKVEMWIGNKVVYAFTTTGGLQGMSFALHKVGVLQTLLFEHPYPFGDPESFSGKKIWYYGLPATVKPSSHPGEIHVYPDCTEKYPSLSVWWAEYINRKLVETDEQMRELEEEHIEEYRNDGFINHGDALSDGMINWFRNE